MRINVIDKISELNKKLIEIELTKVNKKNNNRIEKCIHNIAQNKIPTDAQKTCENYQWIVI